MSQTPMKNAGLGSRAATSPGVRRMPMRMVLPMSTATPKETPSIWSSLPRPVAGTSPAAPRVSSSRLEVSVSRGSGKGWGEGYSCQSPVASRVVGGRAGGEAEGVTLSIAKGPKPFDTAGFSAAPTLRLLRCAQDDRERTGLPAYPLVQQLPHLHPNHLRLERLLQKRLPGIK